MLYFFKFMPHLIHLNMKDKGNRNVQFLFQSDPQIELAATGFHRSLSDRRLYLLTFLRCKIWTFFLDWIEMVFYVCLCYYFVLFVYYKLKIELQRYQFLHPNCPMRWQRNDVFNNSHYLLITFSTYFFNTCDKMTAQVNMFFTTYVAIFIKIYLDTSYSYQIVSY